MSNELFSTLVQPHQLLLPPLIEAGKAAIADIERLLAFQMRAWQAWASFGIGQMEAAADVDDPEGLERFLCGQLEGMATLSRRLMADARALIPVDSSADLDLPAREDTSEAVKRGGGRARAAADASPETAADSVRKSA